MTGTVSGVRAPASGTLALAVQAVAGDAAGLRGARALLDGGVVDVAAFGPAGCAPGTCPAGGIVRLAVDTRAVPDGPHRLAIVVEDGDGALTTLLDQPILVANVVVPLTATVVLTFGSGRGATPPSPVTGGGVDPGAEQARGCRAARLTVLLDARRRQVRRGAVVLRRDRAYRFAGRLTCRRDGARRAAPRGTRIAVRRPGGAPERAVRVGAGGRFAIRLRIERAGAVVFVLREAAGGPVRVRIPVRVAR